MQVEHLAFTFSLLGRGGMFREVFEDSKSWHGEDLLFAHEPHGLVAKLVGVIDGGHASLRRIERPRFSGSVNRNPFTGAGRFVDSGSEFGFCVLINRSEAAIANRVRAGFVNLD